MQRMHLGGEEEGRCGVGDEASEHLKHLNTAGSLALIRCFTYVSVAPRNVEFNPPKLLYRATEPIFSPSAAFATCLGVWFLFLLPVIC